jgi:predicted nucleic acid-binding protein
MNPAKRIVLDANILLGAVFGTRVLGILEKYEEAADFYCPEVCLQEARKYIPALAARHEFDPSVSLELLEQCIKIVRVVDHTLYAHLEQRARDRIASRDEKDWPIVALALLMGAPVWTEDKDFFGSGVAVWTTRTIELYLRDL